MLHKNDIYYIYHYALASRVSSVQS